METLNRCVSLFLMMSSERFPIDEFERAIREKIEKTVRDLLRDVTGVVEGAAKALTPIIRRGEGGYITPNADMYLSGDKLIIVVEVPGASKESIDVRVSDNAVDLEAGFSKDLVEKASDASLFKSNGYRCSLSLPKSVDPSGAKAMYKEGILILELPLQKPKGVQVKIE